MKATMPSCSVSAHWGSLILDRSTRFLNPLPGLREPRNHHIRRCSTRQKPGHSFLAVSCASSRELKIQSKNGKSGDRLSLAEWKGLSKVGAGKMLALCGFGYWVQGFRCFPWLALNFHMAHNLGLHPSTLQLVQNSGNLPMVAKPLFGILSDAFCIQGAHRLPYISIGVVLQVLSWGPLALIPTAREALPNLMCFVLLSNLGASMTEVAMDALVAEYGKRQKDGGLQSYAFMASAVGGVLGNFLGGYFLPTAASKTMFLVFSILLAFQLALSMAIKEEDLGVQPRSFNGPYAQSSSVLGVIGNQISDLRRALQEETITSSLTWIVSSIALVPVLSGSMFCYQTQCLHLDPTVLGMSRVVGQLAALSASVLFDMSWKKFSMRKLVGWVQALYACSLLLDLILVNQINIIIGIPNEVFVICFSSLAETIAQFKLLPFLVLFANLCPKGCEGSLTSFLASTLCLSSIVGGLLGVGLASLIGVTSGDFSRLSVGIIIQFLAALLPLKWIDRVPVSPSIVERETKWVRSKRH